MINNNDKYVLKCGDTYVKFNLDGSVKTVDHRDTAIVRGSHINKYKFNLEKALESGIITIHKVNDNIKMNYRQIVNAKRHLTLYLLDDFEDGVCNTKKFEQTFIDNIIDLYNGVKDGIEQTLWNNLKRKDILEVIHNAIECYRYSNCLLNEEVDGFIPDEIKDMIMNDIRNKNIKKLFK